MYYIFKDRARGRGYELCPPTLPWKPLSHRTHDNSKETLPVFHPNILLHQSLVCVCVCVCPISL